MENILRRVRIAERVVARRAKKLEYQQRGKEKKHELWQAQTVGKEAAQHLKDARKARRDAWELGPLAPRRDVAYARENFPFYGTLSTEHANLQSKPLTEDQKRARAAWCGTPGYLCLEVGDRVVILDGPYRNKISTIRKLNKDYMTVTLGQEILVNQTMPGFISSEQAGLVEPWEAPIPISSVRLVHPLRDPATGSFRDVIVRELRPFNRDFDRPTRKWTFDRVIPGENVVIPWPEKREPPKDTYPVDTTWIDVDERTFVPTLLSPPMPETVIDELRCRYSRYRTRHTAEYIAKREAWAAEKNNRMRRVDEMLTPIQELNRQIRAKRRERGQPELTDEMLANIGAVMERNAMLRKGGKTPDSIQEAIAQMSIHDSPPSIDDNSSGRDVQP